MKREIERKFLVANDGWKQQCLSKERLRDGLVLSEAGKKLRVRIGESCATLCMKGRRIGGERAEFEYEIPLEHAEALLRDHCEGRVVEKTRYSVPRGGRAWIVDVYHGLLGGVVIAEIELEDEASDLELPDWVGEEVTGREEYRKSVMFNARWPDAYS